jgi:hypothetical protein
MKKSRLTESQIIAVLKQAESRGPWPTYSVSTASALGRSTNGV